MAMLMPLARSKPLYPVRLSEPGIQQASNQEDFGRENQDEQRPRRLHAMRKRNQYLLTKAFYPVCADNLIYG